MPPLPRPFSLRPALRARGRMQARMLLAGLVTMVAGFALTAAPAWSYLPTTGTGSGAGATDTLGTGAQPITSASGGTVTLQWAQTAFRGAPLGGLAGGGYTILRHPAAGGLAVTPSGGCATTVSGSAASLTCQETGVPAGDWQYSVTPVLNSWTGGQSVRSVALTVGAAAPTLTAASAQDPAARATTPGDIALTWTASAGATGYDVFRRAGAGSYDLAAPLNGATPLTGTSYTDPGAGLTSGVTYSYVVRARTGATSSPSSNELSATAVARPAAPATTTATATAGARVAVSWSAVASASGYAVYRRAPTGSYDYAAPLNGATAVTQTTFTDTTAVDATAYRYVVRAIAPGAGATPLQSGDGPEAGATADGAAPTAVSLADPGANLRGSVTFTATATGATSVSVQIAATRTTTWADACVASTSPYSCTYATTALADGTYDLRAVASDAAGNTMASSTVVARKVDNTAPAATLADPGAFIRGTVTLNATASDAGSGLASLTLSRAPTGTTTFTQVCTSATSPASCALNTTTLTNGAGYDLRAVSTDVAGNTTTVLVSNRIVDNTAPTGVTVQAVNGTGTVGRADAGDKVTYTYSEPILPGSILAGWSGASTNVTARLTTGAPDTFTVFDAPANTTQLRLGSFNAATTRVLPTNTFTNSTVVLSGNSIVVTLGAPSVTSTTATSATTLSWTTNTAATDRAGNPVVAATIAETGAADIDF